MTAQQNLGRFGEEHVARAIGCLRCKRPPGILKRLPPNFKCADLICEFCGWLAQVKAHSTKSVDESPKKLLGAAWEPQRQRMEAGIYFPLFVVAVAGAAKPQNAAIYYVPVDLQTVDMFTPRKPLSSSAKRAGWQGFMINLDCVASSVVRLT